jgi:2-alkyl-3-oxoalkanoate reductase
MRVFLSGATGVIGKRVVPLLLEAGHTVTVGQRAGGQPLPWKGEVRIVPLDLFSPATLGAAVQGQDAVINLATSIPSTFKSLFRSAWRMNDRIRREGSRNLVEAALAAGVRTLVQESFAPTYPSRGDEWIDESVPLEPGAYNRTVLDAESRFAALPRRGGPASASGSRPSTDPTRCSCPT